MGKMARSEENVMECKPGLCSIPGCRGGIPKALPSSCRELKNREAESLAVKCTSGGPPGGLLQRAQKARKAFSDIGKVVNIFPSGYRRHTSVALPGGSCRGLERSEAETFKYKVYNVYRSFIKQADLSKQLRRTFEREWTSCSLLLLKGNSAAEGNKHT